MNYFSCKFMNCLRTVGLARPSKGLGLLVLAGILVAYLLVVQGVKRWFFRHLAPA